MNEFEVLKLLRTERATERTVEDLRAAFSDPTRTDLDELGALLWIGWMFRWLDREDKMPPLVLAPAHEWVGWFRRVGYLHNGFRLERRRPTEPLTLYRAAASGYERGISWTPRLSDARAYSTYREGQGHPSKVFRVEAEPAWLLARQVNPGGGYGLVKPGGGGSEYMVDVPDSAPLHRVRRKDLS